MAKVTNSESISPIPPKPHVIAVVVFDGVVPTEALLPCDMFSRVRLSDGSCPYRVKTCGVKQRSVNTSFIKLEARFTLAPLRHADTIVLPGGFGPDQDVPASLIKALRYAAKRKARIVSICTGAFVLAAAGLLDGLKATTHWIDSEKLAQRYRAIDVDADVLYVDNGNVMTSAGAFAGVDLCLHIIRNDFGAKVAADVARMLVVPLERDGGQKQFIKHETPSSDYGSLKSLLQWIEDNLEQDLPVRQLAERAAMSPRTLNRRFLEQTGTTPSNWILQNRVRKARLLLETTHRSVEWIAAEAGLGSAVNFRNQFRRLVGTSPSAYRRSFGLAKSEHY